MIPNAKYSNDETSGLHFILMRACFRCHLDVGDEKICIEDTYSNTQSAYPPG